MDYLENSVVSPKEIAGLRQSVGWNRMEEAYNNPKMKSFYHIAAYDKDCLIGYIECVSNGVTDAYIQDIIVHPDYQGQGIGSELINRMISRLKKEPIYSITVVYEEGLQKFYEKFGFFTRLCGTLETYESR